MGKIGFSQTLQRLENAATQLPSSCQGFPPAAALLCKSSRNWPQTSKSRQLKALGTGTSHLHRDRSTAAGVPLLSLLDIAWHLFDCLNTP